MRTRLSGRFGYIHAAALSEQAAKSVAQRFRKGRASLCSAPFTRRSRPSMPAAWECSSTFPTPAFFAARAKISSR